MANASQSTRQNSKILESDAVNSRCLIISRKGWIIQIEKGCQCRTLWEYDNSIILYIRGNIIPEYNTPFTRSCPRIIRYTVLSCSIRYSPHLFYKPTRAVCRRAIHMKQLAYLNYRLPESRKNTFPNTENYVFILTRSNVARTRRAFVYYKYQDYFPLIFRFALNLYAF